MTKAQRQALTKKRVRDLDEHDILHYIEQITPLMRGLDQRQRRDVLRRFTPTLRRELSHFAHDFIQHDMTKANLDRENNHVLRAPFPPPAQWVQERDALRDLHQRQFLSLRGFGLRLRDKIRDEMTFMHNNPSITGQLTEQQVERWKQELIDNW
jgi:hypothetical protein